MVNNSNEKTTKDEKFISMTIMLVGSVTNVRTALFSGLQVQALCLLEIDLIVDLLSFVNN